MGFTSRLVKLDWVVKLLFARGEGSGGGCPLLYPLFLFFLAYSMAQFDQFILRATYTQVAQVQEHVSTFCLVVSSKFSCFFYQYS